MDNKTELGAWTFNYISDGHNHSVTIHAENIYKAVEIFEKNFGESTSFSVSV